MAFVAFAGATGCSHDATIVSTQTTPTVTASSEPLIPVDASVDLQLRPVLQELPSGEATTPNATADQVVLPDSEGDVLLLGASLMSGAVFESAAVKREVTGSYWVVAPVLRAGKDGIDSFNAAAAQCYEGTATCPPTAGGAHGRLALVLDSQILIASTIGAPSFDRETVSISGGYTEERARAIAAALSGRSG